MAECRGAGARGKGSEVARHGRPVAVAPHRSAEYQCRDRRPAGEEQVCAPEERNVKCFVLGTAVLPFEGSVRAGGLGRTGH